MVNSSKVGEICTEHGLQQRSDDYGRYWVHPEFEEALMIDIDDNGNWEVGRRYARAAGDFEKELGRSFDNASDADLGRYLRTLSGILHRRETGSP